MARCLVGQVSRECYSDSLAPDGWRRVGNYFLCPAHAQIARAPERTPYCLEFRIYHGSKNFGRTDAFVHYPGQRRGRRVDLATALGWAAALAEQGWLVGNGAWIYGRGFVQLFMQPRRLTRYLGMSPEARP